MERFSFNSGERQTGDSLEKIRADHQFRYKLSIDTIKVFHNNTEDFLGFDVFCGNGYGSYLVSTQLNCHMLGIDASPESIEFARQFYSTSKIFFAAKEFPFNLPKNIADFVVCMESIEHISDFSGFLDEIVESMKPGAHLFLSTPNELLLSLKKNPNKFHFRHFLFDEIVFELTKKRGLSLEEWYGQDVYSLDVEGHVTGILPSDRMTITLNVQGQFNIFIFSLPS